MRIDLHSHSTASDGTQPPADVVRRARAAGLDVLALTDHDTVAGFAEAVVARPDGLTLALGCEVSCVAEETSVHLLGYLFDPDEPAFKEERELLRDDRTRRAHAIVDKLHELGAAVSRERVFELAGDGAVGRPHLAQALLEAGVVQEFTDAFSDDWIGQNGRAYVEKHTSTPAEAIALINGAGGVAVFAHPGTVKRGRQISDGLIAELAGAGLAALEVDHPDHDPPTRERLRGMARELGLLTTGSSDDHGEITGHRLGTETTHPDVWAAIRDRATGSTPIA